MGHITLSDIELTLAIVGKWCIENNNNLIINHIVCIFKIFLHNNRRNHSRIHIAALKYQLGLAGKVVQKLLKKRQNGISSEKVGSNTANSLTLKGLRGEGVILTPSGFFWITQKRFEIF